MQTILSLRGTPSNSSRTVKPSRKPSTQPRQVASFWMRTGSPFGSLSMLEQSSKKLLPDLLISGCSAALFEPTLPAEQIRQTAIRVKTQSERMESSIYRETGGGTFSDISCSKILSQCNSAAQAQINAVKAQSQSAEKKYRRQIDRHNGIYGSGQRHGAVAMRKIINHQAQQHVQQPSADLPATLADRVARQLHFRNRLATVGTLAGFHRYLFSAESARCGLYFQSLR